MNDSGTSAVSQLDERELAAIFGGEDSIGTSFAYDVGFALGWLSAKFNAFLETAPASNYAYCKTGLS